jgi:hypothetical protein
MQPSGPGERPSGISLMQRELEVRRQGSGITASQLDGTWHLQQIWPKQGASPTAAAGLLLRALRAQLCIRAGNDTLEVRNSVALGALELRFSGTGQLQGRRPLLQFCFERLELRLGDQALLSRPLARPPERRLPFFALILCAPEGWLAARGRGGGLALWQKLPADGAN